MLNLIQHNLISNFNIKLNTNIKAAIAQIL